ncbi:MAG TPA: cytochrome c peroxidase [Saprospiraceae bacterium]|nr:cytochrome c peroxidase [Saprospiraceae bacterium]
MIFFRKIPGTYALILIVCLGFSQCHDTIDVPGIKDIDLTNIPYTPVAFVPDIPNGFPALEQPADNLMTQEGIRLGRRLFFDPILSVDSTISCSSCHKPSESFTDNLPMSEGVAGKTIRSSMNLLNVGLEYNGLFWDGRAASLELQALEPVENHIEMGETWENVEMKLRRHPEYPAEFRKAFGIENSSFISRDLVTKAISQFERTIISGGKTRYDRFQRGEIFLTESEFNGYLMFFNTDPSLPDAQCGHCHAAPLFGTTDYFNNGLQESPDLEGFADKGLGAITGKLGDNGKFKTPTLRNLVFTAPYMHDGSFKTIAEVMEHYTSGGKNSPNKSAFLNDLHLSESQKADVIAFIMTLTDSSVLNNPAFQNPF